jgi:hypothetical protein
LLVARDVEELVPALGDHFEPVPAALKLIAKRANEFPGGVKDKDGRMVL